MNSEYNNPQFREFEDEGADIDIMAILGKLLKKWKFILLAAFIFGSVGVIYALNMKREYGVKMILAPESLRVGGGGLSSLASMMGVNLSQMNQTPDAVNVTIFPEVCQSTPFLADLLHLKMTPYVSPKNAAKGVTAKPVTLFDHLTGKDKLTDKKLGSERYKKKEAKYNSMYDDNVINLASLTPRQAFAVASLARKISADVDKKTGVTTIIVKLDDRRMVSDLADTVCNKLQEYIIKYRTKKAMADYEYYVRLADEAHEEMVNAQARYASRVDYDRSVILQSVKSEKERLRQEADLANQIYSQMAQQRELAKAKVQEARPAYAVIQPATMPQRPLNSRAKVVLVWGFLGAFLACAWVAFGKDFFDKVRSDMKEKKKGA